MKLIVQRVTNASVSINQKQVASISKGYLVLVGFTHTDDKKAVEELTNKLLNLRIMADSNDKFNLTIKEASGELLVVPQFTLYAKTKGSRPSFTDAMKPQKASELFNYFLKQLKASNLKIESGVFAAYMQVTLTNDGPVTITLESNS